MDLQDVGDSYDTAVEEAIMQNDAGMAKDWIGMVRYNSVIDGEIVSGYRVLVPEELDVHAGIGMAHHLMDFFIELRNENGDD